MKQLLIFLFSICFMIPAIAQNERLVIPWPETWKIGSQEKTSSMSMVELVPNSEKVDKWTIIGTSIIINGKQDVPIEATMNVTFDQAKKTAINPTLTVIDKKEDGKNPWIVFKIEAGGFQNDKTPESQLYYIIEGENALYSNFVALKEATLAKDFTDHWAGIFKSSQLIQSK